MKAIRQMTVVAGSSGDRGRFSILEDEDEAEPEAVGACLCTREMKSKAKKSKNSVGILKKSIQRSKPKSASALNIRAL